MEKLKEYTFDEALDIWIGPKGTAKREQYDSEMDDFRIGLAIKQARESRNLTQEQLGKMVGVQKSQISRLETGRNITTSTLRRVFRAMNLPLKLDMGEVGTFDLC